MGIVFATFADSLDEWCSSIEEDKRRMVHQRVYDEGREVLTHNGLIIELAPVSLK